MLNDNGEQICVHYIVDHGQCRRPATHPIHEPRGVSPFEHHFEREKSGVIEETALTKKNVKFIAKRSGQSVEAIEKMRKLMLLKKKQPTLKYDVAPEALMAEKRLI